jgi:hypothetical protein
MYVHVVFLGCTLTGKHRHCQALRCFQERGMYVNFLSVHKYMHTQHTLSTYHVLYIYTHTYIYIYIHAHIKGLTTYTQRLRRFLRLKAPLDELCADATVQNMKKGTSTHTHTQTNTHTRYVPVLSVKAKIVCDGSSMSFFA